jgi:hypothetical protein
MSGSGPERAPFSVASRPRSAPKPHRPSSTRLQRAVVFTETGGVALLEPYCGSPIGDDTFGGGLKVPSRGGRTTSDAVGGGPQGSQARRRRSRDGRSPLRG